ncbi:hypothetical protein ACIRQH_34730 [Streptomyces sp. NPDC102279]|uniref:hypothetical protein n=1 Tax=Streptomyces sp. NPDC102279 TaxID=3366153 RepID=UPI003806173A
MNTRLVNSAAGVIQAAQAKDRTPAGIALALESAGLLMSPEVAAELEQLRARVAELDQQRHEPAPLIAPPQSLRDEVTPQVRKLRSLLAGQRAAVEDSHESPLHHSYLVGRDLPEPGGAR